MVSSPAAARPQQQGPLLPAAIFSGVSPSSQSTETKRLTKDILRKPNHSSFFYHQEAKPLCRGCKEEAESLENERIWWRSLQTKPCSPLQGPPWGPDLHGAGFGHTTSSFFLLLKGSSRQRPASGGKEQTS